LVFVSAIPTRMLYLGTLERVKSELNRRLPADMDRTTRAAVTNFGAGGVASLCSQLLVVPVDVVSQRLMVQVKTQRARGGTWWAHTHGRWIDMLDVVAGLDVKPLALFLRKQRRGDASGDGES
jgi:hypothetical protein